MPVPQPQSGSPCRLAVLIDGGTADTVEAIFYSSGYTVLAQARSQGVYGQGWNYPLSFAVPALPNGTYFVRVRAGVGGKLEKKGRSLRLVILR